jgi:predicted permease
MNILFEDLRYALRQLRRAPGFSLSVVFVLALGIGANAAMFTVLEATLFRPLPYAHAEQLVRLHVSDGKGRSSSTHLADLLVWQPRTHTVNQIAYFDTGGAYLRSLTRGQPEAEQQVATVGASANLFATLGVAPALGRTFTADEQQPGKGQVVVLSDSVWRTQFHADAGILGRSVLLDDTPATIIGVMPPRFVFPADGAAAQIWTPAPLRPDDFSRTFHATTYDAIGRRNPGISIPAVQVELAAIQRQLAPLYTGTMSADLAPSSVQVVDYRRSLNVADQRIALLALQSAVAVLWLIACANVASLMLARTAARRREMAVRSALGASRWRLTRQTLTESLLLSLFGGMFGLLLSQATLRLFRHSLGTQLGSNLSLHPDGRVLFALPALSVVSAVFFGVVPTRQAFRVAVDQALRQDGAQAGTGRHQHRLQRILVVVELALTLTLLVSCGLLLRTVFALRTVPLGFRTDHVFVIEPHLPGYKYRKLDPNGTIYRPLLERLKTIPGVQVGSLTTVAPLVNGFNAAIALYLGEGTKENKFNSSLVARLRASGPELQHVLGFRMIRGRYFTAQDTPDTQLVAVVNQAFAKLYEPNGGDISKFTIGGKDRQFRIVGVIDDFHQAGIADPVEPELDLNAAQMRPTDPFYQTTLQAHVELVLRSTRDARSLLPELQHVMQQFNPDLNGSDIRTMDQIVEDAMGSQLLAAHLLEGLGGLALFVALAGLYSLLAYLVALRTRDFGLRLALGAQRADILTLVFRGAGVLLLTGTAIGIVMSVLTVRLFSSFIFGVKQYDALTFVLSSMLLLLVGTIAAWLPARRAAALEPMQALRTE